MTEFTFRRWYRWRWLPLVLALLSVGIGLFAYFFSRHVVVVDELIIQMIEVDGNGPP